MTRLFSRPGDNEEREQGGYNFSLRNLLLILPLAVVIILYSTNFTDVVTSSILSPTRQTPHPTPHITSSLESTNNKYNNNNIGQISWKCSNDSDLRHRIQSSDNVILVMPPKSAGTSFKLFAKKCNSPKSLQEYSSNIYGRNDMNELLTHSWDMPMILPSHFWVPEKLAKLLRNVSRKTLIIYSHRDETSRFKSAIKHVLTQWCKGNTHGMPESPSKFFAKIDGDDFYLNETKFIDKVLKRPQNEMVMSTNALLTCETYQSMEEYAPNMIFVDYRNATKIQTLLAEKYCPNMTNTFEVTTPKTYKVYITREEDGESVLLSDWMEKKMPFVEWTLGLNDRASCLVKTRQMEDEFGSCEGGFLDAKSVPRR